MLGVSIVHCVVRAQVNPVSWLSIGKAVGRYVAIIRTPCSESYTPRTIFKFEHQNLCTSSPFVQSLGDWEKNKKKR